jgi:hypothetical protein
METTWTSQQTSQTRLLAGAAGGVLGGLAFLPVMVLLQPTIWARLVVWIAPGLAGTPAEFLGWLLHVAVLTGWGGAFSVVLTRRDPAVVFLGAVGWAFIAGWFTLMAISLSSDQPLPMLAWMLETLSHLSYGIVLGGTLVFLARQSTLGESVP